GRRSARPPDRDGRGLAGRGHPPGELRARGVPAPREPGPLRGRRRARRRRPPRRRHDRLRARRGEALRARAHATRARSARAGREAERDAVTVLAGLQLSKRYGEREVVHGVNIEVHPAQVVGLLGPNGAGKTTTFNMMAGGIRPSEGRVVFGDREITDLPMYRRARLGITYLPQEPSIFRKL